MTYRHLEIFIKVAETLNMTTAAERLFIAQPSVSQSISDLERHLKTRLFERLGHTLYLTTNGVEFLSYARHIVSLASEAERRMLDKQRGGIIRIGGSMTLGTTILLPMIKKFKKIVPSCDVFFTVDNTTILEKALLSDSIDMAIVEGIMKSEHLLSRVTMDDELLLICSRAHRFSRKKFIGRRELAKEKFIIREEGSGTRELFESVMSSNRIEYSVTGVVNNAEAIKLAVIKGLGISVMSYLSITSELKRRELASLRIEGINFFRHFTLYYHRNKYLTHAMKKFMELSAAGE